MKKESEKKIKGKTEGSEQGWGREFPQIVEGLGRNNPLVQSP